MMIHRHLMVLPGTTVQELPAAAILDLLDRGDLDDWRPLAKSIAADPHGALTQRIARLVDAYPMYGTSPLWRSFIERCRARIEGVGEPRSLEPRPLAAVRQARGLTQADMALRLGISQSDVSKLERRADLRLSTLSRYVAALRGRLRAIAAFPDQDFELAISRGRGKQKSGTGST